MADAEIMNSENNKDVDDFVAVKQTSIGMPDVLSPDERQGLSNEDQRQKAEEVKRDIDMVIAKFTIHRTGYETVKGPEELNIVVFGHQADGKSAVMDLLLGRYDKLAQVDFQGLTTPAEVGVTGPDEACVEDRIIRVLDLDGRMSASAAKSKLLEVFPKGVHALLYVWNAGKNRFAMDDQTFLNEYQEVFQSGISEYCITLLTSCYNRSPFRQNSIEDFQRRQQGPGAGPLERFMFGQIGGRVVAMEFGDEPNYFAYRQRQVLMQIIDAMLAERGHVPFVPEINCMEKSWGLVCDAASMAWSYVPSIRG